MNIYILLKLDVKFSRENIQFTCEIGNFNNSLITPPTTTIDVHQLYFWRTHHTKTLGVTEYTF